MFYASFGSETDVFEQLYNAILIPPYYQDKNSNKSLIKLISMPLSPAFCQIYYLHFAQYFTCILHNILLAFCTNIY